MVRPDGLADVRTRAAFMRSFLPYALLWLVLNAGFQFAPFAAGQDPKKTIMDFGCDPSKLRIVIDVGHTPEAAGALSARGGHCHLGEDGQ
jgi:hypothetical protein